MLSNLFIISGTGEVLLEKNWRGKTKRTVCDLYWEELSKSSKAEVAPIIATPKCYLINIVRYELCFLSTVDRECPPLLVLEAQHRIVDIFAEYFGGKLNETIIRENFSIVLQLLDEMVDGSFPSTTEPNQLKEMILPPSLANKLLQGVTGNFAVGEVLPTGVLSKIPWRKSDVKYVTNEIYFDVVEQLDCIISANQNLVVCSVFGEIRCNCRLTGVPDLMLTFTRPNLLDDCSLHRCVRINRYMKERVISFVPPDGNFKLLSYRVNGITQLPIYVKPIVNYKAGGGRVQIMVGSKVGEKAVTDVVIYLPLPKNTINTSLSANVGSVKHDPTTKLCRWEIGKIPVERTPMLEGTITLPPDFVPDESPTVRADFQVKMMTVSGLKVDGLAIRGVKYKPFKGVRSVTEAGKFQVRCSTV